MGTVSQESVTRLARQIFERVMAQPQVGEHTRAMIEIEDVGIAETARQSLNAARIFEEEAVKALEAAAPAEARRRAQKLEARRTQRAAVLGDASGTREF